MSACIDLFFSGAEEKNELSKNQKESVHFTQHPDLIELKDYESGSGSTRVPKRRMKNRHVEARY